MTVQRDPDAILAAWLEEGPTALPEPTRRSIAVTTRTTHQRRHPIWVPLRRRSMNTYARWAVAAIAIVLAVGGAAYVLAPAGGQIGGLPNASPTSSPHATATPSPTVTPSPSPSILASEGFVYPGAYVPAFDPPLTFTIDREVQHNCAPGFKCRGSIDANQAAWLALEFGLPRIEVNVYRVEKLNDPAKAGRLIDPPPDLAGWIAGRPGLTVIAQKAVTVGGLAGTQLDVRTGSKDTGFGPIPGVTDIGFGLGPSWIVRLFVVPVQGHQVVISLHAEDGSVDELQPLVDSIVWN
jgi:hypothetical protein